MALGSILGLVIILGSIGYFAVSISQVIVTGRSKPASQITLRILQLIAGPTILFLSGIILLFQGWRQDPSLLFKDFLMSILIGYLILLDLKR